MHVLGTDYIADISHIFTELVLFFSYLYILLDVKSRFTLVYVSAITV